MADDKTEKPTPRRLKDARKKGQVTRSRDLVGACTLLAVTTLLGWWAPQVVTALGAHLTESLGQLADRAHGSISPADLSGIALLYSWRLIVVSGPVMLTAATAGVLTNLSQSGWVLAPQAVHFNWGRLNPANGLQKLKPSRAGVEVLKALVAVAVLSTIGWQLGYQAFLSAPRLVGMAPAGIAAEIGNTLWHLLIRAGLALVVLAGADYGIQRWRLMASLRMTRKEMRDEVKSNDGSPEIKSRVRKAQRELRRRRMLNAVKKATVVVANPTHVSVALEYRRESMAAPVVVAKGADHLALRIRALAREHGVPVVENIALARALYATAEVGDLIPANLFGAVAEVLAYLIRIKQLML
jgi:flagellar biosynthetic protein FlhB